MTYADKLRAIPDLDGHARRCTDRLADTLEDVEAGRDRARSLALAYLAGYAATGPTETLAAALVVVEEVLR